MSSGLNLVRNDYVKSLTLHNDNGYGTEKTTIRLKLAISHFICFISYILHLAINDGESII